MTLVFVYQSLLGGKQAEGSPAALCAPTAQGKATMHGPLGERKMGDCEENASVEEYVLAWPLGLGTKSSSSWLAGP
ncbi:hypothetical protein AOLI_G00219600 [Acnodon oligacanthus]